VLRYWDVVDRAMNSGPLMKLKDFDYKIFKVSSSLVKEYGIKYDPKVPVPSDDGLADRLFEAGVKFCAEMGTYCMDTERVIKFSEEEIREGLRELARMPDEMDIGDGMEKRRLFKRSIGDPRKPLVIGGVVEDPRLRAAIQEHSPGKDHQRDLLRSCAPKH